MDGCNLNATLYIFHRILVFYHRNLTRLDLDRKNFYYITLLRPSEQAFMSFRGSPSIILIMELWSSFWYIDKISATTTGRLQLYWVTIFVSSEGIKLSCSLVKLIVSIHNNIHHSSDIMSPSDSFYQKTKYLMQFPLILPYFQKYFF